MKDFGDFLSTLNIEKLVEKMLALPSVPGETFTNREMVIYMAMVKSVGDAMLEALRQYHDWAQI